MILDIDVGNTRLKWRLQDADGGIVGRGHGTHKTLAEITPAINRMVAPDRVKRLRVANVAGADVAGGIAAWADANFGLVAEFATSQEACAGVTCGYRQPASLGVDRWLALLAAWHRWGESCVVVDAGSALTVDLLAANGVHLGGYIVPGLAMMHAALAQGTGAVKIAHQPLVDPGPGRSTLEAVNQGCGAMALALVERTLASLAAHAGGASVSVVLTGGDADSLAPFIKVPLKSEPELVLDGLALALP